MIGTTIYFLGSKIYCFPGLALTGYPMAIKGIQWPINHKSL